jgi:hypothetical protein
MCHSHHHPSPSQPGTPHLRASDQERERTTATLQRAAADGRLTISELEERLQTAWAARTRDQLTGLTHDLGGAVAQRRRTIHWHPALIWAVPVMIWLVSSVAVRALGL